MGIIIYKFINILFIIVYLVTGYTVMIDTGLNILGYVSCLVVGSVVTLFIQQLFSK